MFGALGVDCAQSAAELQSAGAPSLTDDGATVYCEHHESEAPDGRAVGITRDGGAVAYVVYTIVGGGSALDGRHPLVTRRGS